MSNSMVCRSFIFYIKIVGLCTKIIFIHITTFGNNPHQLTPMDLVFLIIPMLMRFSKIFDIVLLLMWILAQSWYFNCKELLFMFVHEPFTTYICQQNLLFLYVTNRFWEWNRYFMKQLNNVFTKHCC